MFLKLLGYPPFRWMPGIIQKEDGTTAIEFSLLAIPYVFLTLGIIEISLMYAAGSMLEGATSAASRLIRTGQIQQANVDPEEAFRNGVCTFATVLVRCDDVVIEVQNTESFDDIDDMNVQVDEDGNVVSSGFDAGGSGARVLIRTSYRYQMMTPFIGSLLTGGTGSTLFISTIVLQTEPYDFGENVS